MSEYNFRVPPTAEMGGHAGVCRDSRTMSHRADALLDYNHSREREGLEKLRRMPAGTIYTRRKG